MNTQYYYYYFSCPAETMGEAGLQLFLDAGCVVDNDVVNSLIKEVLLEKITSMTGESTTRDRPPTRDQASDDRLTASYDEAVSQVMTGACNYNARQRFIECVKLWLLGQVLFNETAKC